MKELLSSILNKLDLTNLLDEKLTFLNGKLCFDSFQIPLESTARYQIVTVGKNAIGMAQSLERYFKTLLPDAEILIPLAFSKEGEIEKFQDDLRVYTGSHPQIGSSSFLNGKLCFDILNNRNPEEWLIFGLSGGASAIIEKNNDYFSQHEVSCLNDALLKSGMDILEMNSIRREVSKFKNGGFAALIPHKNILTFAISDIPDGSFNLIGSGPTVLEWKEKEELTFLCDKYLNLDMATKLKNFFASKERKMFFEEKARLLQNKRSVNLTLCDSRLLQEAAIQTLRTFYPDSEIVILNMPFQMQMDEGIVNHLDQIREKIKSSKNFVIVSTGELPVKVKGNGLGGRNSEFVLQMAFHLFEKNVFQFSQEVLRAIQVFSFSPDGSDGSTDSAGGFFSHEKYMRGRAKNLNMGEYLSSNDSYSYLKAVDALIKIPKGVYPNLMDLRVIMFNKI